LQTLEGSALGNASRSFRRWKGCCFEERFKVFQTLEGVALRNASGTFRRLKVLLWGTLQGLADAGRFCFGERFKVFQTLEGFVLRA
jgi:hypothetical protein